MSTASITGASAGLGLEFAKLFAADQHDVVLVARRKDRLDALCAELAGKHGVKAIAIAADLMDPGAPAAIVAELEKQGLEIEFLVNNAGFGASTVFAKSEAERERGMVEVNVTALTMLTHKLLPGMLKRGRGRILNIGSTAGFQPGPFMTTYYATKAYVNSFSQALTHELKGSGVTCTLSCPGATKTEFGDVADMGQSRLFAMGMMTAPDVASQAYRAMHRGKRLVVHGFTNKITAATAGMIPTAMSLPMVAAMNQDPNAPKRISG